MGVSRDVNQELRELLTELGSPRWRECASNMEETPSRREGNLHVGVSQPHNDVRRFAQWDRRVGDFGRLAAQPRELLHRVPDLPPPCRHALHGVRVAHRGGAGEYGGAVLGADVHGGPRDGLHERQHHRPLRGVHHHHHAEPCGRVLHPEVPLHRPEQEAPHHRLRGGRGVVSYHRGLEFLGILHRRCVVHLSVALGEVSVLLAFLEHMVAGGVGGHDDRHAAHPSLHRVEAVAESHTAREDF